MQGLSKGGGCNMLIEKIIGNVGNEEEIAGKKTEWIELDWEELSKRILRTETDQGTDIALRLESRRTTSIRRYFI